MSGAQREAAAHRSVQRLQRAYAHNTLSHGRLPSTFYRSSKISIAVREDLRHDPAMHMSVAMWIAIGAGVIGLAMSLVMLMRSSGRMDLGSVSEQWMAQHRAGRADDPQR